MRPELRENAARLRSRERTDLPLDRRCLDSPADERQPTIAIESRNRSRDELAAAVRNPRPGAAALHRLDEIGEAGDALLTQRDGNDAQHEPDVRFVVRVNVTRRGRGSNCWN